MSDLTIENTNKKIFRKETPAYLKLKDVYHFRKDHGCILTKYEAIKDFISDIKNENLNINQVYDYIINSDLYNYLSNQCNRYIHFYGNPEFKDFYEMRENFKFSKEINLYKFIYNILLNEFNVNNTGDLKAESRTIKAFFMVNLKHYLIHDVIVPESKKFYPRATDYTTELLTLFHKSAGYEYPISEYYIEDIMDGINITMEINSSIYGKNKKVKNIVLKTAYTVWRAYTPSGNYPKFKNEENRKKITDYLRNSELQFSKNSTSTNPKDVFSNELTIEKVKKAAESLFDGKDLNFFNYWFDKTIFDNDLMSSSTGRACKKEFKEIFNEFTGEEYQWKDIQDKINKQRIKLINILSEQNLVFPENYIVPSKGYSHRLFNLMQEQEKKAEAEIVDFSEKRNDIVNRKYISSNIIYDLGSADCNNIHSIHSLAL